MRFLCFGKKPKPTTAAPIRVIPAPSPPPSMSQQKTSINEAEESKNRVYDLPSHVRVDPPKATPKPAVRSSGGGYSGSYSTTSYTSGYSGGDGGCSSSGGDGGGGGGGGGGDGGGGC